MKKLCSLSILLLSAVLFLVNPLTVFAADTYSEDVVPQMRSNVAPAPFLVRAGSYSSYPYQAFDNSKNWSWISNYTTDDWLSIDLGEGKAISKYTLQNIIDKYMPKSWTFEGSSDNVNWTILDTRKDEMYWVSDEKREYTFTNATTYRYYRIHVTSTNGGSSIAIAEMELMEKLGSTQPGTSPHVHISTPIASIPSEMKFEADVVISNADKLYAEEVVVQYDSSLLGFEGAISAKDGLEIYHQSEDTPGTVRLVIVSKGEAHSLNGNTSLVSMTFTTRNTTGKGRIDVKSATVANATGIETVTTVGGKEFTVTTGDTTGDVNQDGKYSVADLAIVGFHYGKEKTAWNNPNVDVDRDGYVEDFDLAIIVEKIVTQ